MRHFSHLLVIQLLSAVACRPDRDTSSITKDTTASESAGSTADSIAEMLKAYETAAVQKDTAALRRLIDTAYIGLGPGGDTSRQSDAIAFLAEAPATDHYDSLVDVRPRRIQVRNDTGSVVGQMLVHGVYKSQMFIHRADYEYRVIRRPEGWKVIFSRFTHAK